MIVIYTMYIFYRSKLVSIFNIFDVTLKFNPVYNVHSFAKYITVIVIYNAYYLDSLMLITLHVYQLYQMNIRSLTVYDI